MMEEFKKLAERSICSILNDNDIDYNHKPVRDAIGRHFKNKAWVIQKLGLNVENGFSLQFPLPESIESRPLAYSLIQTVEVLSGGRYKMLDLSFMWQGKNKVRLGKVMAEIFDIVPYRQMFDINAFAEIFNQIGVFYSSCCSEPSEGLVAKQEIYKKFMCFYGDYVKNGRVGVISANPVDYFKLSGAPHCSFTSCIRPQGEYFNTAIHYLNGGNMLPYFIREKDRPKNIGRCCLYLSNDIIATGREFGSLYDPDTLFCRDKIQELFGGSWVVKGEVSHTYICNDSSAYVDYGSGTVTVRKDVEPDRIFIENGECLKCGGNLNTESEGVCEDCRCGGYVCDRCDDRIDEDDVYWYDDHPYCCSCFDEIMYEQRERRERERREEAERERLEEERLEEGTNRAAEGGA
jgi:hypothetical protein